MQERWNELFDARRRFLEAQAAVLDIDDERELVRALTEAVAAARREPRSEQSFRLQTVAELAPKVTHRGTTELLVDILGDNDPSVRAVAARSLDLLARRGRYAEVIWAVERVLDAGDPTGRALQHIPAILLAGGEELDEPVPIDLLVRLLDHDDAETVAAAACALVELEIEGVEQALAPFQGDDRLLSPEGAPTAGAPTTLGELIEQLLLTLELDADLQGREPVGDA